MQLEQLEREWEAYSLKKSDFEVRVRTVAKKATAEQRHTLFEAMKCLLADSEARLLDRAMSVKDETDALTFRTERRAERLNLEKCRDLLEQAVDDSDPGLLESWESMRFKFADRFARHLRELADAPEARSSDLVRDVVRELESLVHLSCHDGVLQLAHFYAADAGRADSATCNGG